MARRELDFRVRSVNNEYRCNRYHFARPDMLPRPTLEAFDRWLTARTLRLEAIVVGGSALALLGVTDRQTRDVDILHPELPAEIADAAREFAAHLRTQGTELGEASPWLAEQDAHPGWRDHVRLTLEELGGRLGHGL